ncbi:hypothetical protein BEN47_06075 [Hymenobacter lapidarius]|uniref:Phage terminase large subunit N-terminal domain-containing protein n=1 Tax=Hymenobacter lapidarius TaxID=1908237 RepID=A0A1G1SQC3_9BACT|nr:phage terminase large subunit [Hymenobacter lapidarius]OGX80821.1 hypothetical protein BEN47_06075 [Hymenobacter lapidarius]
MVAQKKRLKLTLRPDAVSPRFWPYLRSRTRHLLLWGGRDSTKSDFVALKLLLDCLELPYFKCVLVRRYLNTVGPSQVATLETVAKRWGLHHLFKWGVSPLGIWCRDNGNSFVPFGMDDMDKIKSLSNPTHAWYEEANQADGKKADVISTSLRSSVPGSYLQEIYTFNPDHSGDYTTFWLYQKFFDKTGHPHELTFSGQLAVDVSGQLVQVPYEVVHSTYHNNPWCPPERAATYEAYGTLDPLTGEMADEYRYHVWCLGQWATKRTGNEFYHKFQEKQVVKPTPYLPGLNIVQSWDANSLPYCAMFCAQTEPQPGGGILLRVFQEYAIKPPNSGIESTGQQFLKDRKARQWDGSAVYLTGDASLRNNKIGEQRGESVFKDVRAALAGFTDTDGQKIAGCLNAGSGDFWLKKNPGVDRRRNFVNALFEGKIPKCSIQVDPDCVLLINDWKMVQKAIDGKLKKRVYDAELDAWYEPIAHFSDIGDYYICTVLKAEYEAYRDGK